MSFSGMRGWLAGGAMIVALATTAQAQQDPKALFDARYGEINAAMIAKDAQKLGALLAPEYQSTDIRGETRTRAEVLERMGMIPAGVDLRPETHAEAVTLDGDRATVTSKMTAQVERPDDKGGTMKLDIAVTAADTWVQRGGAWLLQNSVHQELAVSRDGEVVFRQAK